MSFISIIYFLIFHSLILSLLAPKQSVWAIMEKATDLLTFTEEILGKFHFSKYQPNKMIKHTQTIRRQFIDESFECVWPFCGIVA